MLLGAFVACVPWGIRNVRSLDAVIFVRSNFGLEMHIGNHEGAQASIDHRHYRDYRTPRDWSHPRLDVDDALEIAALQPIDPDWPGLASPAPVPGEAHWHAETAAAGPEERAAAVARRLEEKKRRRFFGLLKDVLTGRHFTKGDKR